MALDPIDRTETKAIVDHLRDELNETVDTYMDDEEYDLADFAEAVTSIAMKLLQAVIAPTSPVQAVLPLVVGPVVNLITGTLEAWQQSRREGERLQRRILRAETALQDVAARADRLRATPEREFAERFRLRILERRARELSEKLMRLRAYEAAE